MLKVDFWDEIKRAAQAIPSDFRKVDRYVREYHEVPKVNPLKRLAVARMVCYEARNVVERYREFCGSRVAAQILVCAAEDTMDRLKFDRTADDQSRKSGQEFLPLQKEHRHEALDPEHRRWALIQANTQSRPGSAYKVRRQEWRDHLLRVASDPSRAEQTIQKFYDFVGRERYTTDPKMKTKYYGDLSIREKKRLIFVRPGEEDNNSRITLIYRATKHGLIKPYTPRGATFAPFVMLEGNRFYAASDRSNDKGVTHHSTLSNGEPILGAGGLKFVTPGSLWCVTQQSGHYHPTPTQFLATLRALGENGIDLNTLVVHAYTYFKNPPEPDPDDHSLLPALKEIEASYYLETEGGWATDPHLYREVGGYQPAPPQANADGADNHGGGHQNIDAVRRLSLPRGGNEGEVYQGVGGEDQYNQLDGADASVPAQNPPPQNHRPMVGFGQNNRYNVQIPAPNFGQNNRYNVQIPAPNSQVQPAAANWQRPMANGGQIRPAPKIGRQRIRSSAHEDTYQNLGADEWA